MTRLILALLLPAFSLTACGPKNRVAITPVGYAAARTATLNELIEHVNRHYGGIEALSVSRFQVKFTGGSIEAGYLKEYPSAKGHLVTKRPNWIYVNILNPVTSSSVVTMASNSREFQIWVPHENKYLTGKTDIRTSSKEPLHSVRPEHLLQAILVEPLHLSRSGTVHLLEEAQDRQRKFYVIHEVSIEGSTPQGCLRRKLWLERQNFVLMRQQYYDCGKLLSDIHYTGEVVSEQGSVTSSISMERIPEHYRIQFWFQRGKVHLNRMVEDSSFFIPKPPRAEVVIVEGAGVEDN